MAAQATQLYDKSKNENFKNGLKQALVSKVLPEALASQGVFSSVNPIFDAVAGINAQDFDL